MTNSFPTGLDDAAKRQFLRQRAQHRHGQERVQAGGGQDGHIRVVRGHPRLRQEGQRQIRQDVQHDAGKGTEADSPTGAAAQAHGL